MKSYILKSDPKKGLLAHFRDLAMVIQGKIKKYFLQKDDPNEGLLAHFRDLAMVIQGSLIVNQVQYSVTRKSSKDSIPILRSVRSIIYYYTK